MSMTNSPNPNAIASSSIPILPKPLPFERIDTHSIKQQLHDVLGEDGLPYWKALNGYLLGQLAKSELEGMVRGWFKGDKLELHNTLLLSLLNNASIPPTLYTPIPTTSAARKRKRVGYDDVEYDIDEEVIQPKGRVTNWITGVNGRERVRIRRSVLGKNHQGEDAVAVEDEMVGGRRMSGWGAQGNYPLPPSSPQTRHLPSSSQLSLRLSQYAKTHQLSLAPDATSEIGEFLAVGLDSHVQDMLYGLLHLTGHDRPGINTIRLSKGSHIENIQKGIQVNGEDDAKTQDVRDKDKDKSQSQSHKLDLNSLNHLLMLNPTLNPTISPVIHKLHSGQIHPTEEQPMSTPVPANGDVKSPLSSTRRKGQTHDLGGKPRSEVVMNRLLENSLLKLDNAKDGGTEQKKEKKHTLHWKYEDPAVLLRDFLG
ncbi:hypothetical protein I302_106546 [Kwoniella bestiolae CBS 10118]|uniref:Transcriptional coactivator HFI1/ADA1 n=1 Tax=Kwoniella bestiolae CBS 10118 TaxID=1296100 RepID=A0A1B9G138_9TREE|nr:hypothetical protein I302_06192 [Kwoniella bestiolae CBS 10118]OCF24731.1 hypothetical protein I302_06192 [Kwoniella bestiolae CBS 10118]